MNTKQHLLQNDQSADTTLLHSHDDLDDLYTKMVVVYGAFILMIFFLLSFLSLQELQSYVKNKACFTHLFVKNWFFIEILQSILRMFCLNKNIKITARTKHIKLISTDQCFKLASHNSCGKFVISFWKLLNTLRTYMWSPLWHIMHLKD